MRIGALRAIVEGAITVVTVRADMSWTTAKQKKRLLELVIERDGTLCFHCKRPLVQYPGKGLPNPQPEDAMTLDHVLPRGAKLGIRKGDIGNLVLSCQACNWDRGRITDKLIIEAKRLGASKEDLRRVLELKSQPQSKREADHGL